MLGLSSLDVIPLFEVGAHGGAAWRAVYDVLSEIHRDAPFAVYFADDAGYKAAFVEAPEAQAAARFERLILGVNVEAMSIADGPLGERMQEEGVFELWWD